MRYWVLLLLHLGGCASVPDYSLEHAKRPVAPGNGVVVAQSVSNAHSVISGVLGFSKIGLLPIDKGKDAQILYLDAFGGTDTFGRAGDLRSYVGEIPEGRYRVAALYGEFRTGESVTSVLAPVSTALGTFEVKRGHVTDLGSIVFYPMQVTTLADKELPNYVVTRRGSVRLVERAAALFDDVQKKDYLLSLPRLVWDEDGLELFRASAMKKILAAALPQQMIHAGDSGAVITAKLGTFFFIKQGRWTQFTAPTLADISAVRQLDGHRFFVAGESGLLGVADVKDGKWTDIEIGGLKVDVVDAGVFVNGSLYALTVARDETIVLYFIDSVTLEAKEVWVRKRQKSKIFAGIPRPMVVSRGDGLRIFVDQSFFDFDAALGVMASGEATEFSRIYRQMDGVVIGRPTGVWSVQSDQWSGDEGKTWKATEDVKGRHVEKPSAYTRIFRDADGLLFSTGDEYQLVFDFVNGSYFEYFDSVKVLKSLSNGSSWQVFDKLPKTCNDVQPQASLANKICVLCDDGRIIEINESAGGKRLVFEPMTYTSEDFPRLLMRRKSVAQ